MKKTLVFILLVSLLKFDLFSQHGNSVGLTIYKDVAYTGVGKPILLMDIYLPGENRLPAGMGVAGNKSGQATQEIHEKQMYPVLIWLPRNETNKFPIPVAAYTGNGYAIISLQYDAEEDIPHDILMAINYLNSNSSKYNLELNNTGIIQPMTNGYRAIVWQSGMERIKSLSGAKIKIELNAPEDFKYSRLQSVKNTNTIIGFFDKYLKNGVHNSSDPLAISCPVDSWVDPITNPIPGTTYHLFPTPIRGQNTFGSYLIYLPIEYDTSNKRYPVIYWLHGGNGNSREGSWMSERMNEAMRKGVMPKSIVVFVQGLPIGWYNNSKDGTMPVEDVIIRDLIPHIDATYRTINFREARGIEGMSMGGYGSLHLGFKYPELFGVVSSIAPSITTFEMERKEIIAPVFENDTSYFNINSPAELAGENADYLRKNTNIRLLVGDEDFLFELIGKFHLRLNSLEINHQYSVAKGADHDYREVIEKLDYNAFDFWKKAFVSFE
jgi:enterochelin esterase-like enzyme